MLDVVVRERLPERVVAEYVAQHVQDATALLGELVIEDLDRLSGQLGGNRSSISHGVLADVRVRPHLELVVGGVATLVMFSPYVLRIRREAFVEPALAPVATRDQIAEPLECEL